VNPHEGIAEIKEAEDPIAGFPIRLTCRRLEDDGVKGTEDRRPENKCRVSGKRDEEKLGLFLLPREPFLPGMGQILKAIGRQTKREEIDPGRSDGSFLLTVFQKREGLSAEKNAEVGLHLLAIDRQDPLPLGGAP
jgi:hypothetical protein